MSEVIPFVPKHELDCQKNLNDFICRAKNQLTIYEDQGGFSSSNWKHYLANGRAQSMEFTGLAEKGRKTGSPMEPPFVDFAKAYVRDSQTWNEPYRVCRRVNILRDYPDEKIKIYP